MNGENMGLGPTITFKMLQEAVKEAVRVGLFREYAHPDEYIRNWESMKQVLIAAMKHRPTS